MTPPVPDTPVDEISGIYKSVKNAFTSGRLRTISFRRTQLAQLAYLLQDNRAELQDALFQDLGRHPVEASLEISSTFESVLDVLNNLEKWTADVDFTPETNPRFAGFQPILIKQPIGVVLIISPYNSPVGLTLKPLAAAIGAGCSAVMKPSELCVHTWSLLYRLIDNYLDRDCYRTVLGGSEQATRLLDLKWGHIDFTGGIEVGKIVAAAAAKFLTPITLELGGKSPVVIDKDYDMELAARRILWGKIQNAGQICVAPDYVLVPKDRQDAFVAGLEKIWYECFPAGSLVSDNMSHIINERHYNRVKDKLERTKGQVVLGGQLDPSRLKIDLTIVRDVRAGDSLLEDEIFGPILAIVPINTIEEATDFISERPEPLALYLFSENESVTQYVRDNTTSGSFTLNDTLHQLIIDGFPLGGIGASGYGYHHGRHLFNAFTHTRPCVNIPKEAEPQLAIRYPPYTKESYRALSAGLLQQIPVPRAT